LLMETVHDRFPGKAGHEWPVEFAHPEHHEPNTGSRSGPRSGGSNHSASAFTQRCARWSGSRRCGTPDRAAERVAPTWPVWAPVERPPGARPARRRSSRRRPAPCTALATEGSAAISS
jgi:hypothetical protein